MGGHGDLCTSSKSMGAKLPGGAGRGRGLTYGASLSITVQRSPEKRAAGLRQADSCAGPEGWTWAGCSSGVGSEVRFVAQLRGPLGAGRGGPSLRGEPPEPSGGRGRVDPNRLGPKPARPLRRRLCGGFFCLGFLWAVRM